MVEKRTLTFCESASATTEATAADIGVRIAGATSFSGQAPEQKAKMVQKLFEGLMQLGIPREDLVLRNVSFHVEKGLLSKSAAATFDVLVRCRDVRQLGPTLGKLAESKLEVTGTSWIYAKEHEVRAALTGTCVGQAALRAQAVAEAHGGKAELWSVEDAGAAEDHAYRRAPGHGGEGAVKMRSAGERAFDELPMSSFKDVRLNLKVVFALT